MATARAYRFMKASTIRTRSYGADFRLGCERRCDRDTRHGYLSYRQITGPSDRDLCAEFDHAARRQLEEAGRRQGVGRQPHIERDAPAAQIGMGAGDQGLAAEEE